ncbi:hypothetical protein ZIOFF_038006 [Zingiber officinale]|uniref:4-coumarate--CoA ligase n=2 Tax=Zingiber officinale TaxID=94328 RepID=A0A8J5GDZ9_ZINOF|nr:hypothetical protein ZIOFF_038006 [Zingiber officinale]
MAEHLAGEEVMAAEDCQRSGFCADSGVFRSLHRLSPRHLPSSDFPLDAASFVLSLLPPADRLAFLDLASGQGLSFSDLRRSVLSLAAALSLGLGIRPGDVVLLLAPNSVLYPVIALAVLAAGAVLCPASPLCTTADVVRQVRDSGASIAIAAPEEAHKTAAAGLPTLLTRRPSPPDATHEALPSAEEMMEWGDPMAATPSGRRQSDPAAVLYSSGTTGSPKGAVLTHGNLIAAVSLLRWASEASGSDGDVYLAFIPMSHVYGLVFFALGLPTTGARVVVMPRFELAAAMEAVARHGVTNIPAVPPVVTAMAKSPQNWDLSGLRRIGTGAAAMPPASARGFRRRYPWVELREGYGLTETCGAATFAAAASTRPEGRGVGQLLPGFEARVVAPATGKAEGPGGVGELWLRGATVMWGYLGNDVATAEAVADGGWLRTGDLVYFDEDGYLFIVDRIKELIKPNGYQVTPTELEALLATHPHILDAAVVPLEDEEAGQVPMAFVVRASDSRLTSEEVMQFVASQVAPYKKIRRVAFIGTVPRSPAGKILRKDLITLARQAVSPKL